MSDDGRKGILTAGTWCLDVNRLIEYWPEEDGIAECFEEEREGGGSGCNLALDMRALDPKMPVGTIGLVGDDESGAKLLAIAKGADIACDRLRVMSGVKSHISEAFTSQKTRRRSHIHAPGVSATLTPDHFDFTGLSYRYLHLGLPGCHRLMDATQPDGGNGWKTVLQKAKAAGLQTNLELITTEPATLRRVVGPCLPYLDMLIINDAEIGALAEIDTIFGGRTDSAACLKAAQIVLQQGAMQLVVAHSPVGAVAVTRDGMQIIKPSICVPDDEIAGPNGAGDAFAAGMLYGLHQNWALDQTLALAHASAASSLRKVSTTQGVQNWQECLTLAEKWGWREKF